MATKFKYKSRRTTEETVRRLFSNTPEDSISLEDVFRAWGRNIEDEVKNKQWLSNKLTHLKYHNLIVPIYAYRNNRRILEKLQLTLEGKRVMGRIEEADSLGKNVKSQNGPSPIPLLELAKLVAQFKNENKENYEVSFDVKLKSG